MTMLITLATVAAIVVAWGIFIYNSLVRKRVVVEESWSGIDVQLKRRLDLVPNLVSTVKGYAAHEKTTLEELVRIRGLAQNTQGVTATAQAQGDLGAALGRLFALAENYPDLKANQNFIELQSSLRDIEEQIQFSRRYYNGAARDLNIAVKSFPSNIIAARYGFSEAEFFELESGSDRNAPAISF